MTRSSFTHLSPHLALLIGVLAASTAAIFIRYAHAEGVPSLAIAALRLTVASLILTPFALRRSGRTTLRRLPRRDILLALVSGLFLAIHFASWVTSLEHVSVLVGVVLVDTSPLWVALLSPLLLREPLNPRTLLAIGLAFVGGILVSLNGDASSLGPGASPALGSFLALIGAAAVALYMIIGRRLRAALDNLTYIWLVYGSAALTLLLTAALTRTPLAGHSGNAYFWIVLMALIPQLIGHSSFNYALGLLPAAYVSLVTLGEPIGSAILALLLFAETPGLTQIIGSAIILVAVVVARQKEQPPVPPDRILGEAGG